LLSAGDGQATIMFAESAAANQKNYRKNETPMRFLRAKTVTAFRFFVGLTIVAFAFFAIVPTSLLAQETATTTEEISNFQFPISNEFPITNDQTNATSTEEISNDSNDQLSIINDSNDQLSLINDPNDQLLLIDDPNDQLSLINDNATATSTEDQNDQLSIINDDAAATSTEDQNDQLSIINDNSTATSTVPAGESAESLIEVEFTNVHYGQVGEGQAVVASQITSSAIIRNVGAAPAAVMVWQDDMGLGRGQDGEWNIQYGARAAGGEWIYYDPFEMILLPDVLAPGQAAEMEFSVRVLNFLETEHDVNYHGIMTINGVAAPQGQASLPLLNDILSDDADNNIKPESGEV